MSPTRRRRAMPGGNTSRWPSAPGCPGRPVTRSVSRVFLMATLLNGLAVMIPGPQPVEWIAMLLLHLAFVAWMAVCDRRMRRQREEELAALTRIVTARAARAGTRDRKRAVRLPDSLGPSTLSSDA